MFDNKSSGMEIMLKSLGLEPLLDGIKTLVNSGAIAKIVTFSDKAEKFDFDRLNRFLDTWEKSEMEREETEKSNDG